MPDDRQSSLWVAVGFAWRLGYSIAVPLVILLGVGRLLDRRLGTSPWLMLAGLALSFVATNVLMFREALRVIKQAEDHKDQAPNSPPQADPPREDKHQAPNSQ